MRSSSVGGAAAEESTGTMIRAISCLPSSRTNRTRILWGLTALASSFRGARAPSSTKKQFASLSGGRRWSSSSAPRASRSGVCFCSEVASLERFPHGLVYLSQPFNARPVRASMGRAYAIAIVSVSVSVLLRFALAPWLGVKVPYLPFFPAILISGWYGGLGPGAASTVLSTLAAMYFFLPPDGFAVSDAADAFSLPLFVLTGLMIAWLNHQRRSAEESHRVAAEQGSARAERLDAVFNTAVDGIIVISDNGIIEALNRGAERLFGYPEAETLGRNVNMLMPSPYHGEHDGYLRRYTSTETPRSSGPAVT